MLTPLHAAVDAPATPAADAADRAESGRVSRDVFGGDPVELAFLDEAYRVARTVSSARP